MKTKIILGAPTLCGKDANEQIAKAFAQAKFPLFLTISNLMPFQVVFPEVKASLRSVAASSGNVQTVLVSDMDKFQRFASSVEQVAELNGVAEAFAIEADDGLEEASDDEAKVGAAESVTETSATVETASVATAEAATEAATETATATETAAVGKKSKKS